MIYRVLSAESVIKRWREHPVAIPVIEGGPVRLTGGSGSLFFMRQGKFLLHPDMRF